MVWLALGRGVLKKIRSTESSLLLYQHGQRNPALLSEMKKFIFLLLSAAALFVNGGASSLRRRQVTEQILEQIGALSVSF